MRQIIKRTQVVDDPNVVPPLRPQPKGTDGAKTAHAPGVELVELEPGRHALRHTCRCGETALIEIEVDPSSPQETQA